jgi:hypothetical protein
MFSTDADLLAYEPGVFGEVVFAGQRTVRVVDGVVSGATIASETGGLDVLVPGDVLLVIASASERVAAGVAAVVDGNEVELTGEVVGLSRSDGLVVEGRTFEPQRAVVHEELMRSLGIDVDDPSEEMDEMSVVSAGVVKRLEVLGTLAMVYGSAAALGGENAGVEEKASAWKRRFGEALVGARVLMDADGDGRADTVRTPGIGRLVRG